MDALSPLLALLAGALTVLSPCVLPLAPILAASAMAEHRLAPLALASGLATSFAAIGLFLATLGFALGIEPEAVRGVGAAVMIAMGVLLLAPPLQAAFATAAGPVSAWAQAQSAAFQPQGVLGHGILGLVLGAVWSPCVGPTLGAATSLAASGRDLGAAGVVMAAFGVGAAAALTGISYAARATLSRRRALLQGVARYGKALLGGTLLLIGVLTLTGVDRVIETALTAASPAWLTELTTRF